MTDAYPFDEARFVAEAPEPAPEDVRRTAAGPGLEDEGREAPGPGEGACPSCGRDSCEGCGPKGRPRPGPRAEARLLRFEEAGAFLARIERQAPPSWLAGELVPDEGIVVWHGRPRSMKSLAAVDAALALATGTPALGNERFAVPAPVEVLWLTEEDGERLLGFRLRLMLAGRGLDHAPERLKLLCRPGWNLERPEDQAAILGAIREHPKARVLFIDPARASMPSIDMGPGDGAAAVRFLRQIQRETDLRSLVIPHHDTKPARDKPDLRARPERASGGVIFSVADCPVNFERLNDRQADAFPTAYKLGADPAPFRLTLVSETPPGEAFRGFLRAEAATVTETDVAEADRAKVLAYVREHPWSPTREVDHGAHLKNGEAARFLTQLEAAGLVVRATGAQARARGRSAQAVLWGTP